MIRGLTSPLCTEDRAIFKCGEGSPYQKFNFRTFTLAPLQTPKDLSMITQVYATILIGEMKDKSRKVGIRWEPRAFLTRYTRVNERKHDWVRFLFLDSMTCDLLYCVSQLSSSSLNLLWG
ncbi:hypothetical protein PIB30_080102 [Stylosanthes scabra]|uniref:Uncharacterized protein n=1 Tax=Stylosanthes scabra TaxID=79078 RepID=A0ABU6SRG8_9FABA|nr:hypothetical protein [Stylosanthes scabra]